MFAFLSVILETELLAYRVNEDEDNTTQKPNYILCIIRNQQL